MQTWLLRISVVLSVLLVLTCGTWWVWREFYSADKFREAVREGIETGDLSRAGQFKRWGADTAVWREQLSEGQALDAALKDKRTTLTQLISLGARTSRIDENREAIDEYIRGMNALRTWRGGENDVLLVASKHFQHAQELLRSEDEKILAKIMYMWYFCMKSITPDLDSPASEK